MWSITQEFRSAFADLFRTRRDVLIVLGLVFFGAIVSAAELLTAQLFAEIILPSGGGARTQTDTILLAVLFLGVFASLRFLNYAQSIYRVNVFEKALQGRAHMSRSGESWQWATAMELTSILTMAARVIVIVAALFFFSPLFGIANLLLLLVIAEVFGLALRRQLVTQQGFRDQADAKDPASSADKVRARIKAGEASALIASLGVMGLMGVLIVLAVIGNISAGAAIVIFLAVRMLGQMYSGISSGLMRFARARINGR
jgi:hypothetical protein